MTAALLMAVVLAPMVIACQEPAANPADVDKPSDSAQPDPAQNGSARARTEKSRTRQSNTVQSNTGQPDSKKSDSKKSDTGNPGSGQSGTRPSTSSRGNSRTLNAARARSAKSEELRFLQNSVSMASQLRSASRDAFERGLLPLSDYSDQLTLALRIETAVADQKGSEGERRAAQAAQASQIAAAADQLRQFNQPAARGWAADLVQAELLSAKAAAQANANDQNPAGSAEALQLVQVQAFTHYQLRALDFANGLASLPDLSRAASYLTDDIADPKSASAAVPGLMDYQARMQQILSNTESLARTGAEGGRIDRVREAQLELGRTTMLLAGISKDKQAMSTAFADADGAAQELLASQSQLYNSGTVQLFDMARSWSRWQDLHQQASQFDMDIPESADARQQNELQSLIQLADQQPDLRGRIAADVAMVHSLKMLADLRQLEADAEKSAAQSEP